MRLYLVQHGKATPEEQDPQRPLTPEGRQEAEKVARFLKPLGLAVDRVWHSGKTRAWQTAQIYAEILTIRHELTARAGLDPNDDVAPLRDELTAATEDTMLVGHMPFVSKLASLLLTGHEFLPAVAFRNAGVVCLSRTPDNRWQVEWIVTPELLP
jgi:phosphohistidine phosphatase